MRQSVLCVFRDMKLYRPCLNLNLNASLSTDSTIVKIITIQLSELSETHKKYANLPYTHSRARGRTLLGGH